MIPSQYDNQAYIRVAQELKRNQKPEPSEPFPVLLFLGLFENTKENLKNTKDFLILRTQESPENKQKTLKKTKEFRSKKNTKEKKDRVFPGTERGTGIVGTGFSGTETKPEPELCLSVIKLC